MSDELQQQASPDAAPSSTEPVTVIGSGETPNPNPPEGNALAPAPKTDIQLIEERFQVLEDAFLRLPHSIATVMARGSQAPEEFAAAVHAHLFSK